MIELPNGTEVTPFRKTAGKSSVSNSVVIWSLRSFGVKCMITEQPIAGDQIYGVSVSTNGYIGADYFHYTDFLETNPERKERIIPANS